MQMLTQIQEQMSQRRIPMKLNRTTWMAALLGVVAVTGLAGCGKATSASDKGAANLTIHQQALVDISNVTVSVSGAAEGVNIASVPLVGNASTPSTQYSAVISDLPISATPCDYQFTATATNSAGVVIYTGVTTGQCIAKNQTANIVIDMNDTTAHTTLDDEAPFIDSITTTAGCVSVNDTVTVKATAHDIDTGDTAGMTFVWSVPATCGTLVGTQTDVAGTDTTAGTSTVVFKALSDSSGCQVNLVVKDKRMTSTLQTTAVVAIQIGNSCAAGLAKITAIPDTCPAVTGLASSMSPLVSGQTATLTVSASDSDGDALNYHWTSDCHTATLDIGHFVGTDPASATGNPVQFVYTGSNGADCNFYVNVDDGVWADGQLKNQTKCVVATNMSVPGTASGYKQADSCKFSFDYLSTNSVDNSQPVTLMIAAPCANPVWSAGTPTTVSAPFTTGVTFTTPSDAALNGAVVTVSCPNATNSDLTCTHTFNMIGVNAFCATANEGDDCTSTAQKADKCILAATCQGGLCKQTSYHPPCQTSTTQCKDNKCDATTGQCALVAAANGGSCSDGLVCTTGDTCNGGACTPTGTVSCTATGSVCSVNACSETATTADHCAVTYTTVSCDDGKACTTGDKCDGNGACTGTQTPCSGGQVCSEAAGGTCQDIVCLAPQIGAVQTMSAITGSTAPVLNGMAGGTASLWTTGKIYPNLNSSNTDVGFNFGANTIKTTGSADVFLNKLDPATGKALASFSFGESSGKDQVGAGVAVDKSNNVALIGSYGSSIVFTTSPSVKLVDPATTSGAMNFFMVFNGTTSGLVSGAPKPVAVKGQAVDVGLGALQAVASNPNVDAFALCGKTSIADLGVGNTGVTDASFVRATDGSGADIGGMDIIVAVVNNDGTIKWGKQFGGAGDQSCSTIAMDGSGNVYIGGTYNGDLSFDTAHTFTSVGTSGIALPYVAVLAAADGSVTQAKTWGSSGNSAVNSIATDGTFVYIGGALDADISFGSVPLTDNGQTDSYVVKMDASLTPKCGTSWGDARYAQAVKAIGLDPAVGQLYVGGQFKGQLSPLSLSDSADTNTDGFTLTLKTADCSVSCQKEFGDGPGGQGVGMLAMQGTGLSSVWIGGTYSSNMTLGSGLSSVALPYTGAAGTNWSYIADLVPGTP
jgi:hypothetical protein